MKNQVSPFFAAILKVLPLALIIGVFFQYFAMPAWNKYETARTLRDNTAMRQHNVTELNRKHDVSKDAVAKLEDEITALRSSYSSLFRASFLDDTFTNKAVGLGLSLKSLKFERQTAAPTLAEGITQYSVNLSTEGYYENVGALCDFINEDYSYRLDSLKLSVGDGDGAKTTFSVSAFVRLEHADEE